MKKEPKYYYYNEKQNLWFITKKINGKRPYLGAYPNEEQAKTAVKLFKKYGWSKENNWKIKAEVKEIFKGEITNGTS